MKNTEFDDRVRMIPIKYITNIFKILTKQESNRCNRFTFSFLKTINYKYFLKFLFRLIYFYYQPPNLMAYAILRRQNLMGKRI